MASVYLKRLQLLTSGYARINTHYLVSTDVSNMIVAWLKEKINIEFNPYYILTTFDLEIYLIGFVTNVLNPQHISKYRIIYAPNKHSTKYDQICRDTKNIYDSYCMSFTNFSTDFPIGHGFIKVSIIDINDNIIVESNWKEVNVNSYDYSMLYPNDEYYDKTVIQQYFKNNFELNDNGYCNINEWIKTLKRNDIESDEFICRRLFYCILVRNDVKTGELMNVEHFVSFLSDRLYAGYCQPFISCIHKFREIGFVIVYHEENFDDDIEVIQYETLSIENNKYIGSPSPTPQWTEHVEDKSERTLYAMLSDQINE